MWGQVVMAPLKWAPCLQSGPYDTWIPAFLADKPHDNTSQHLHARAHPCIHLYKQPCAANQVWSATNWLCTHWWGALVWFQVLGKWLIQGHFGMCVGWLGHWVGWIARYDNRSLQIHHPGMTVNSLNHLFSPLEAVQTLDSDVQVHGHSEKTMHLCLFHHTTAVWSPYWQ